MFGFPRRPPPRTRPITTFQLRHPRTPDDHFASSKFEIWMEIGGRSALIYKHQSSFQSPPSPLLSPPPPHFIATKCLLKKSLTTKTVPSTPPPQVPLCRSPTLPSDRANTALFSCKVRSYPIYREYMRDLVLTRPRILSADFHFIDLLAHFDRERIPERVCSSRPLSGTII